MRIGEEHIAEPGLVVLDVIAADEETARGDGRAPAEVGHLRCDPGVARAGRGRRASASARRHPASGLTTDACSPGASRDPGRTSQFPHIR
ncbi:DUF6207 family protein [Streptomyces cinereoruber]|uniref:DUF6207 family protein n=1 Tax=Streptomyces cinereoruber TaxID=67260 RepID=UPI003C2B3BFA